MSDQETGSLEEGQLTYWDISADGGGAEELFVGILKNLRPDVGEAGRMEPCQMP